MMVSETGPNEVKQAMGEERILKLFLVLVGGSSNVFAWRSRPVTDVFPAAGSASKTLCTAHCTARTAQLLALRILACLNIHL